MNESVTPTRDYGGPYLAWAFLCEREMIERDGVHSFIRAIDRLVHVERGPDAPVEMPVITFPMSLVIAFRAGQARGSSTLVVEIESPSGMVAGDPLTLPVHFEGEDRGAHFTFYLGDYPISGAGLYWFTVKLDDRFVTKVPLRVVYQRYTS
ncbi:MAG TPA: hypothetical protein DCX80_01285 [Chloroflexi bacterium]|jgi:hypothetical protein|nr:hypothetical protein [Chloroflexota bacterium]